MNAMYLRHGGKLHASIAALVLGAVVACGGGDDATPPKSSAPAGMTTFRYDLKQTSKGVLGTPPPGTEDPTIVIVVAGEVAGPKREHLTTTMSLGSSAVALERIEFDDRAWSRDFGGTWTEDKPGGTGGMAGVRVSPLALLGAEANTRLRAALKDLPSAEEQVGGKDALRFAVAPDKMRVILGGTADNPVTSLGRIEGDTTLWVTKDGMLPLRLVMDSKAAAGGETHVDLAFKDHNTDSIKLAPPS